MNDEGMKGQVSHEEHINELVKEYSTPPVSITDIVTEFNLARVLDGKEKGFEERRNCVYLPLIGNSDALNEFEELNLKPQNYIQLVVNPQKATARSVASFFNSELGHAMRQSLLSGTTIPKITKTSILAAKLYLRDCVDAMALRVEAVPNGYQITYKGNAIITHGGHPVTHSSKSFLEHMWSEFDQQGELQIENQKIVNLMAPSAYDIFSGQKYLIEELGDIQDSEFLTYLQQDPVLDTVAGPEVVEQLARYGPVKDYLASLGLKLLHTPPAPDENGNLSPEVLHFVDVVKAEYRKLIIEQRACVRYLNHLNDGSFIFPIVLVLGRCTSAEYSAGVMASLAVLADVFEIDTKEHKTIASEFRSGADTVVHYLSFFPTSRKSSVEQLIQSGESLKTEFKSTLRFNLKTGKNDDAITDAVIKTIAAFLNTNGGTLLIGVDDKGAIVGVEKDDFTNDDKFQRYLIDKVKSSMGDQAATNVSLELFKVSGLTVCQASCNKSTQPVFVTHKGGNEEDFFVRTGPATTKMRASEIHAYIKTRFPEA